MELQPGQVYFDLGAIPFGRVDEFGVDWAIDAEGFDGWGATGSTIDPKGKPRSRGAWAGTAHDKERYLAAKGRFYAPTPEAARLALDRLNVAVGLDDTLLTVFEPGLARSMMVRKTSPVLHKWLMPTIAEWSFQVMAPDGRKLGATQTASTHLPSTSGGLTIPFTVPFSIPAVQVSGQISLTNSGNTAGPVMGRIDGPCVGPVVTHVGANGGALVFASSLVLGAGEWLDINYERREVKANGQASRNTYITARGWSTFESDVNTWSFTAASYTPGAQLTITATSAWK